MDQPAPRLRELSREERMLLMHFVCAFAWADREIRPQERALVARQVARLGLDPDEARQVEAWLQEPPGEAADPNRVPGAHRMLFLRALESIITVDGEVAPEEREALIRFARLAP